MCISHRWTCFGLLLGLSLTVVGSAAANEPSRKPPTLTPLNLNDSSPLPYEDIPNPRLPKEDKNSPIRQQHQSPKKSPLEIFLDVVFGPFKKNGSTQRTTQGVVCPIAPGLLEDENKIFSDRPLFVWQGNVDTIEIQDYWTGQIIQSDRLPVGTTSWQYSGPSLQLGEVYIWTLRQGKKALVTKEFQVMSRQEREHIMQEQTIERITNPFDSKSLSDAAYFSKHKFWSDSLTSLYEDSDEQRASIIQDRIDALGEQLCNEDKGIELASESSQ